MTPVGQQILTDIIPEMIASQGAACLKMYGSSMAPILAAGKTVRVIPTHGRDIQIGDIVCFKKQGGLTAHRVVKVSFDHASGQSHILTKGDNRKVVDPPLPLQEILGKITAIEDCPITTPFWRAANFLIAKLSYWEALIHQKKSQSKLWLFLHRLKKRTGLKHPLDFISPIVLGIPSRLIQWMLSRQCAGKEDGKDRVQTLFKRQRKESSGVSNRQEKK